MAMNALILSGFQAVQIAEVLRRLKQRQLLHFVCGKTDEVVDSANFHGRVRPIVVEATGKPLREISRMPEAEAEAGRESDSTSDNASSGGENAKGGMTITRNQTSEKIFASGTVSSTCWTKWG